ncbi:MAG: hypothetical protein EHM93_16645 [Bacteroidales bacterium]|nr:MAG: hypothetical protein EHM93_16645 [Bacteroidales bacterium]
MPKSKFQEHHPVILEYWTDEKEIIETSDEIKDFSDIFFDAATTINKVDSILGLLSVFTNNLFFRYYDSTGMWGMPVLKDEIEEENNLWSSKWNFPFFHWPELPKQMVINEFTKLEIPEVKYVKHFDYYSNNPNFDYKVIDEITFPNTITSVLNSYYSKTPEIQSIIDTAISFSYTAMELRPIKKTVSLLSSFTSLETMVNLEFRDFKTKNCEKCGQPQYKIAEKFRDFLFKYIGKGEENRNIFNSYYSIRSKIVHTGQRLKTEKLFSNIPKKEKDKEFLNHIEILQLGKLSIIHWLIRNK